MKLNVTVKGLHVDPTTEHVLHHKLSFALDRFGRLIQRVDVALEDVNGPKGGVDKRCRLLFTMPRRPQLVVEERGDELLSVVTSAIDRAAQSLDRLRGKRQSSRHPR